MVDNLSVIAIRSVQTNVNKMRKNTGFTLIEIIIVIGILAILAVLILMIVNPLAQFQKANDARRKEDLSQIQRALEQYYQDNGVYPTGTIDHKLTNPQLTPIPWGTSWSPYMNVLPADKNGRSYVYISTGQKYWLYAGLERGGIDVQACKNTSSACQSDPFGTSCQCDNVPSGVYCGSTNICTYGISSPNTTP